MNVRKTLSEGKRRFKHLALKLQGKQIVHFLHIGKTGGTAVKYAIEKGSDTTASYHVALHPHHFKLKNVPQGEQFFFFLRDPISRFKSGFYSRQRQGKPRYYWPWSPEEKIAFETFDSPNELALGLSSGDQRIRQIAETGMKGIQHVRDSYWDWFKDEQYFKSRSEDLFYVGFQESLKEDFLLLKSKLQLPENAQLPTDEINAHKNPKNSDKGLDAEAIENLEKWYSEDYRFMSLCRDLINSRPGLGSFQSSNVEANPSKA